MGLEDYTTFCLLPCTGGERLDKILAGLFPRHPRASWRRLIERGAARINGEAVLRPARAAGGGAEVRVDFSLLPPREEEKVAAEDLPLRVVHEDGGIIVIDKAAGVVVHPGSGNRFGTLQAALQFRHPPSAFLPRGGIVHRLDKDTTGLLVAAKTESARRALVSEFKLRRVRREYLALVHGAPPATGVIDRPLAPQGGAPGKMAVRRGGKEALTRFAVVRRWRDFSMLRCWLETGRTHQIRAHLEYAGYPLAGDRVYTRRARGLPFLMERQALHAEKLHLRHPESGEERGWDSAVPADMESAARALDKLEESF